MADNQLPDSTSVPESPQVDAKPVDNSPVEGSDMHIHKPKPLHKFREVLGEIGIIVIGILIAIALEQVVDELHWSREVVKARGTLHAEAAWANSSYRYRVAANPCVERRLAFLEDITERAARGERVPKLGEIGPNIDVAFIDSSWQAQKASQVLTHFDDEELHRLGVYYFGMTTAFTIIGEEAPAWQTIEVLEGDPNRLSAADFANVRVALKKARETNRVMQLIAHDMLSNAVALRMPSEPIDQDRLKLACAPIAQRPLAR